MNTTTKMIIRTVVLIITWVNMVLVNKGMSPIPFDESAVAEFISYGLAGLSTAWVWWKNNNVTRAAIEAQSIIDEKKGR